MEPVLDSTGDPIVPGFIDHNGIPCRSERVTNGRQYTAWRPAPDDHILKRHEPGMLGGHRCISRARAAGSVECHTTRPRFQPWACRTPRVQSRRRSFRRSGPRSDPAAPRFDDRAWSRPSCAMVTATVQPVTEQQPSTPQLPLGSDFAARAVSPYREMGACETLWSDPRRRLSRCRSGSLGTRAAFRRISSPERTRSRVPRSSRTSSPLRRSPVRGQCARHRRVP